MSENVTEFDPPADAVEELPQPPVEESGVLRSYDEVAQEIREGKWGNRKARRIKLTAAGYDYKRVMEAYLKK